MDSINKSYVYEHWRPDTGVCFYVGKGKGGRANCFVRNRHYNSVVSKLNRIGMEIEVKIVCKGMKDTDALALEVRRIALWRRRGVKLTNATDGGEGISGYIHTAKALSKISKAALGNKNTFGMTQTKEAKLKISLAMKGRRLSKEVRAKISRSHEGKTQGPHSEETKIKMSLSHLGKKLTEAAKNKLRAANLGKKRPPWVKAKMREAWVRRRLKFNIGVEK